MSNIPLRYYQDAAISAIYSYFASHKGNPIIGLPTGTGKSVVIAALVAGILQRWPGQRILILTHRKELIQQNAAKLLEVWPEAPVGIFSAGLGDKTYWMPVTFGGVGSVYRGLDKFYQAFDLILIDECHLISPAGFGMYGTVLAHFKGINDKVKVIGFTATAYRLKQGMLTDATYNTDGDAIPALFTDIIYDLTDIDGFLKLVNDGFLCKPIVRPTHTQIDISGVKVQAGEYNQKQLEKAVDIQSITEAACNEIIWYGQQRWAWLVFGTSIDHAEHIAATMQAKGVACEAVHSKLKGRTADERLEAFKRGELRCIVNNDKLTTGFDHPPVDLIGMLRHTMSPSLWVQMVGRGTRPYDFTNPNIKYIPGYDFKKQNCLVLDFARNIERLGPINDPVLPKTKTGKKGDMPVKICPHCGVYNFGAARFCDECGFEFEFQTHIETSSDGNSVIFRDNEPVVERYSVIQAAYKKYRRNDTSLPMMFCTYICVDNEGKPKNIRENVLFEHDGFARRKAEAWFAQRHGAECPITVDEAMKYHPYFKTPKAIRVRTDQQYPEVLAAEF